MPEKVEGYIATIHKCVICGKTKFESRNDVFQHITKNHKPKVTK